jgi:starch-binding outer membrane protein, SusD/RagB family
MKRFSLTIFLLSVISLSSCKKFLSESSQDELRPTTTSDLNSLLIGTAYPYRNSLDIYLDLLTDDIQCNGLPKGSTGEPLAEFKPYLQAGYYLFRFDPMMFDQTELGLTADQNSWLNYYKLISGCNLILDYLDKVTGSDEEKRAIKGQALCLRGFYYFKLANIYGRPYDEPTSDPATNLAVPLLLTSKVSDERRARNTVKQVYDQVEKDLMEADELLDGHFTSGNYRVGHLAAKALLSRFYLYKGDGESLLRSAKYASLVIDARPSLTLLTTYFTAPTTFSTAGIYDPGISQEIIWNYGLNPVSANAYFSLATSLLNKLPPFIVSNDLLALYEKGPDSAHMADLRFTSYFSKYNNNGLRPFKCGKVDPNNGNLGNCGIRTAEMYLNRAEVIIRLNLQGNTTAGTIDKALDDINTLRISRYDTRNSVYQPIQINDVNALWAFYKDERRRELCLEEGHRWFDIRRWRLPVHHKYIDILDQVTEVDLTAGDLLYALPIPYPAMDNNNSLVPNPR